MPTAHRRTDPALIGRLLQAPQRFQFFQAVRLLVAWLGQHGVAPELALLTYLRFDNSVSMSFPASQIEALIVDAGPVDAGDMGGGAEAALRQALLTRQLRHIRITPSFMGLLGCHGVLPSHYSERIAAHQHGARDDSARAFLDLFSGRAVAQFYQAWNKYRLDQIPAPGEDKFARLLLALVGRQPGDGVDEGGGGGRGGGGGGGGGDGGVSGGGADIGDEVIAYYGGLLQQRPMSAAAMQRILGDHLGVPVALEESVGHMNHMLAAEQTALGLANQQLGGGATLGPRMWRPDLRARLRIGPLDRAGFERFLPGGPGAATIRQLLGVFGNALIAYEIVLILEASAVGAVCLDSGRPASRGRLGFDTFLPSPAPLQHRAEMRYDIRPMAPIAAR